MKLISNEQQKRTDYEIGWNGEWGDQEVKE